MILQVKGDFCHKVRDILKCHDRAEDYVEIGLGSQYRYNPLNNHLDSYALAYDIASLLNNLFGRGKEPFWQQAYTNLVKLIILLDSYGDDSQETFYHEEPTMTGFEMILRLPGFASKKYDQDYYVQVHAETNRNYQPRDFRIQTDSPEAPRQIEEDDERTRAVSAGTNSRSENDWAYAKRVLARGDDPEEVIRCVADYRATDKDDPLYYARHTVMKAQAEINARAQNADSAPVESSEPERGH